MADQIFKISIKGVAGASENVVIKHYIDQIYPCFDKFMDQIFKRYESLRKIPLNIYWIDSEGDKLRIHCEEDFRLYVDLKGGKLFIEPVEKNEPPPTYFVPTTEAIPVVQNLSFASSATASSTAANEPAAAQTDEGLVHHYQVVCDGCEGEIYGYRYKCLQCVDFDLCMKCENKMAHKEHVMMRIPVPRDRIRFSRGLSKSLGKGRCCSGKAEYKEHKEHKKSRGSRREDCTILAASPCPLFKVPLFPTNGQSEEQQKMNQHIQSVANKCAKASFDILSNISQNFAQFIDPFGNTETNAEKKPEEAAAKQPTEEQRKTEATEKEDKTKENPKSDDANVQQVNFTNLLETLNSSLASGLAMATDESVRSAEAAVTSNFTKLLENLDSGLAMATDESVKSAEASAATSLATQSNEIKESSPALSRDWAIVDADGLVEEPIVATTGAIPKKKTSDASTSVSSDASGPTGMEQQTDFEGLAKLLRNHIRTSEQAIQTPPEPVEIKEAEPIAVSHPNPKMEAAIRAMMSMGFSNNGGWLTQLLESVEGNIPRALDLLHPQK